MKKIFISLLFYILLMVDPLTIKAACVNPPECPMPFGRCGGGQHCLAGCCVPNGGGSTCNPNNCNRCCKNGECKACNEPPPPVCDTTAPTNVSVTRTSATSATVNWTIGTNGTAQRLYVGANKTEVESNCPGISSPVCVVKQEALGATTSSYATGSVLVAGTTYYVRVNTFKDATCSSNSTTATYLSSCTVSPASVSISVSATQGLTTSVSSSSEITQVTYQSSNPGVATVTTPDASSPYTTTVTGISNGSSTVTSDVYFGGTLACSNTAGITVINPDPWWQVTDSDISSNGNLTSGVPSGLYFGLAGPGGYPGIPSYSGSTNLTTSNASALGWLANSGTPSSKLFDYQFYENQIPDSVIMNVANSDGTTQSDTVSPDGYIWYKYTGSGGVDMTLPGANIGGAKVVLFVENADLTINGNYNLNDGTGFFGVFVEGSITVNPSVTSLEGIYLADSSFSTGAGTSQLDVRGSVAAYGGISLERDFGNGTNLTTPAETFTYAPDQILRFPGKIAYRKISWKEVAP